ncbi:MAG TPA: LD-carboxypeptidase [Thermoanaerobaculia bacterium]|nr:LD-carboxypeptidase [Thermoanaerobaculia bacterium]
MLIRPRALPRNGSVVVLAMSSPSELPRIEAAARTLEQRGLRVTLAANIDHRHRGYLAGDDAERLSELNHYLRSDDIDAFFFARGGYGAMRILDGVDYDAIRANPRPIVGFSDITALHQAVAVKCGIGSFHGPMLNLDWAEGLSPAIEEWFWSMLAGDAPLIHHFERSQVVIDGEADGVLFGGCLSLTTALTGTPYDFWVEDGIWFFEDVDEPVYRIDRMLTHLRLSGRLKKIRAVVIGKLKGCGSDAEIEALLHEFFASSNIPVIRDLPFGHQGDNLLMPIGVPVRVSTRDLTLTFAQPAVQR